MKITLTAVLLSMLAASAQAERLVLSGSDTIGAKLAPQLAAAYTKKSGTTFTIRDKGSSTAFTDLGAGTCDIGMSSRDVTTKDRDKAPTAVKTKCAADMIAVIVNSNNGVADLTSKQIAGIFTGKITDWSEVGGSPGKINVYTRNELSGTYKSFQEMAMGNGAYAASAQKMAGNEQIASEVKRDANGVGYVGIAYVKGGGVKAVTVNGVACSPSAGKKYKYYRDLYWITLGKPAGKSKAFIDWATTSADARAIIERVGFLPPG